MSTQRVFAFATIVALFLAPGCKPHSQRASQSANLQPFEILIDWQAEPTYLGVYYAKHLGLFEELGLDAAFTDAICLIEWPDRLGPLTPAHALSITFTAPGPEDVRTLAFTWTDDKWTAKTESLRHV